MIISKKEKSKPTKKSQEILMKLSYEPIYIFNKITVHIHIHFRLILKIVYNNF